MLQQDQNLSDSHALCRKIALPGACLDEHRSQDVHEEVWGYGPIGWMLTLQLGALYLFEGFYLSLCSYPRLGGLSGSANLPISEIARTEEGKFLSMATA